jgi:taurine transport system permease protein
MVDESAELLDSSTGSSARRMLAAAAARVRRSTVPATVLSLAAVVGIWWLAAVARHDAFILPSPPQVFNRFIALIDTSGQLALLRNAVASLVRVLVGWSTGAAMGIAVGAAMASSKWVKGAIDPLIEIARPMPALALAPLLIIWFGLGELPKYIILWFVTFPVLAIATSSAILGVDRTWIRSAETLGASRRYILGHVILPASMPGIFTGLRLASGLTWGTLIAAEIIASTKGLGWMILQAQTYLDTSAVFVGIIAIGVLALTMDRLLRLAEGRLIPWRGMQ